MSMSHDDATADVRLIHGDCRLVLPTLEAGSISAIITDPPYGTQADKDGYGRRHHGDGIGRFIDGDSDLAALAGMLELAPRVLKPNSWLAVFCSPKRHAEAADLLESSGFPVGGEVIWDKASPGLGGGIRYQHETILLAKHGKPTGCDSLFSVIRHHLSRINKHERHPHEKPVPLMCDVVKYCSNAGEIVLDPFAGSGSTGVAFMKTGRKAILIESDAKYIPAIHRRIAGASTPLFAGLEAGR